MLMIVWRRLLNSPTAHYESIELELLRVGAPLYSSGTSLLGEGETAHTTVSNGNQIEEP